MRRRERRAPFGHAAETLSRSHFFECPGVGHGAGAADCARDRYHAIKSAFEQLWPTELKGNFSSIVEFFHDRYDQWGREAPLLWESTLNKIGAFSLNPRLKLMLGQQANHLDFRTIMDEGKILLLDLGHSDGETNRLIRSLVVTRQKASTSCFLRFLSSGSNGLIAYASSPLGRQLWPARMAGWCR